MGRGEPKGSGSLPAQVEMKIQASRGPGHHTLPHTPALRTRGDRNRCAGNYTYPSAGQQPLRPVSVNLGVPVVTLIKGERAAPLDLWRCAPEFGASHTPGSAPLIGKRHKPGRQSFQTCLYLQLVRPLDNAQRRPGRIPNSVACNAQAEFFLRHATTRHREGFRFPRRLRVGSAHPSPGPPHQETQCERRLGFRIHGRPSDRVTGQAQTGSTPEEPRPSGTVLNLAHPAMGAATRRPDLRAPRPSTGRRIRPRHPKH
jgi:hypothetical protein